MIYFPDDETTRHSCIGKAAFLPKAEERLDAGHFGRGALFKRLAS